MGTLRWITFEFGRAASVEPRMLRVVLEKGSKVFGCLRGVSVDCEDSSKEVHM